MDDMTGELPDLHQRAMDRFGANVLQVRDDQWERPTPCADWDVRALVNHVVNENRWTPPLIEGQTMVDVGDRFDGDLLGGAPKLAWEESAQEATAAVHGDGALDRTVHLSFGDVPGREYVWQLFADILVHGWDLAKGIGADDRLDRDLVETCAQWFAEVEDAYRSAGAIGPRPDVPDHADAQTRLLAAFGRASKWG
jgi:uncharacterized protein (TIGR03086 family)